MNVSVRKRVALVTGANRGLGLETSRQLLARGMTVVMTGRDQAALERARDAVDEDAHTRAVAVPMDVTDAESIDAAYRIVRERVGSVDVLVNNAAVLLFDNGTSSPSRQAPIARRSRRMCSASSTSVARSYPKWHADDMAVS